MKKNILFILLAASVAMAAPAQAKDFVLPAETKGSVHFSPRGGCTEAIVAAIDAAQKEILVQAYSFTSREIAEALERAAKRGVAIQVIADHSQETDKHTVVGDLAAVGIAVRYDETHKIAHNKVIILDQATLITGSFNFTASAENSNAENLLILRSPLLAAEYAARWNELWEQAVTR
jgi:phosphatidylserine/phosphatidylglycerophosphate/cardiolipin synthase-like enzyme